MILFLQLPGSSLSHWTTAALTTMNLNFSVLHGLSISIVLLTQALTFFSVYHSVAYDSLFISHSLPIPKGLAPLVPAHLDVHLISLINQYTLRGVPILIHCCGGISHAGIITCCWAIRLGLCGSCLQSWVSGSSEYVSWDRSNDI